MTSDPGDGGSLYVQRLYQGKWQERNQATTGYGREPYLAGMDLITRLHLSCMTSLRSRITALTALSAGSMEGLTDSQAMIVCL
jgi:hypothetical protein